VGVRASTEGRFAPAAPMAERRSSGGGARARRSGRRRLFIAAGGRLGVLGSTTSPVHARRGQQGAATCGGAAAQWRAAVGTPASGKQPPGTVQALTDVTHSSTPARCTDRWVLRCLGVRAPPGYGAPTWRYAARRRARERRCSKPSCLALFQSSFLQKFK
jgi:hypothetical protein